MNALTIISFIFSIISITLSFLLMCYTKAMIDKFRKISEPMKEIEKIIEVSKKILDIMPHIPTKDQLDTYVNKYNEINILIQKLCIINKVSYEKLKNSDVYSWEMSDELIQKLNEIEKDKEDE